MLKTSRVCVQMDDPSISDKGKWSKARFDEIVGKLTPFLRSCGYNPARDFVFCPIAALTGGNVLRKPAPEVCEWWTGQTLFEALDSTEAPARDPMASFRMPIMDKYKDMGTVVMGKSESGVVQVLLIPAVSSTFYHVLPNKCSQMIMLSLCVRGAH